MLSVSNSYALTDTFSPGTCLAQQLGKGIREVLVKYLELPSAASATESHDYRWAVTAAAAFILAGTLSDAHAENADISIRRAAERTTFSNDEIKEGFFKTAFHAELDFGRQAERIRKFDEPVRVFVINRGEPNRGAAITAVVADIAARVKYLDVATTADQRNANFIVTLVPTREFAKTIRNHYGEREAKKIQQSLHPDCLSGIAKDGSSRIQRAEVILPVDAEEFRFYDCAYEELLQGLGLINDDASVPWTMFNDDVQMGFFDTYDQYLVNILYDPRIQPGMSRADVEKVLPDVLPTVRTWVGHANSTRSEDTPTGSRVK